MTSTYADIPSQKFIRDCLSGESDVLREVREFTAERPDSFLQISPDQGKVLKMLASAVEARAILEIGVHTGYSALWMASALPPDGIVVGCDVDEELLGIARRFFERAGVSHLIETRLGLAEATIADLLAEGRGGSFDVAFIDADKEPMDRYYEGCLRLLRTGGLVIVDNVLWEGRVARPEENDPDTVAMREILFKAQRDPRVESCVLPVGDGLLVARKLRD